MAKGGQEVRIELEPRDFSRQQLIVLENGAIPGLDLGSLTYAHRNGTMLLLVLAVALQARSPYPVMQDTISKAFILGFLYAVILHSNLYNEISLVTSLSELEEIVIQREYSSSGPLPFAATNHLAKF